MRKIAILLCFFKALGAQTSSFPAVPGTDTDFKVAKNRSLSTLSAAISSSATSITVANGNQFAAPSLITLEDGSAEIIAVCAVNGNVLTVGQSSCPNVDGRGFDGSTPAAHNQGSLIYSYITAWHHNMIRKHLEAIENLLGPNGSNFSGAGAVYPGSSPVWSGTHTFNGTATFNGGGAFVGPATFWGNTDSSAATKTAPNRVGPTDPATCDPAVRETFFNTGTNKLKVCTSTNTWTLVSATTYGIVMPADFTFSRSPGGSLSIGNNIITLSPVPVGLNWNDAHHAVYVSGGTGTAEACPILAAGPGTAVSGAASGTITITCAHTHSGAWTISSASSGIDEALRSTDTPHLILPPGSYNVYATVYPPAGAVIEGPTGSPSSGDGNPVTISHFSNSAPLFQVATDHVSIQHLRLVLDPSVRPAVSGGNAVQAATVGGITLSDLDIYGFWNGINVNLSVNGYISNNAVNNCYQDAFVLASAQGYIINNQAVNNIGNGFTISGFSSFIRGVHSYDNGGWGAYVTSQIQIVDMYLNNEALGNLYINVGGGIGDGGSITHVTLQYAGQNLVHPELNSATAPAIYIASGSAPVRLQDLSIFAPNGNAVSVLSPYQTLSNVKVYGGGIGGVADNLYCIDGQGGGGLIASQFLCNLPVRISGNVNVFRDSYVAQSSASYASLHLTSTATNNFIDGNFLSNGAGSALTVDSGATLIDGFNQIQAGGITNNATRSAQSFPNISPLAGYLIAVTYSQLGSATGNQGKLYWCADCTTAATCAAGGSGHIAASNNTAWTCQ